MKWSSVAMVMILWAVMASPANAAETGTSSLGDVLVQDDHGNYRWWPDPNYQTAAAEIPVPLVSSDSVIASLVADEKPASRLRTLERRRMGLTAKNIIRVLREMKAEGKLTQYVSQADDGVKEIDVSNLAVAVAGELASENPQSWQDLDWDRILEFIEKLLAILIEYLPIIFGLFM